MGMEACKCCETYEDVNDNGVILVEKLLKKLIRSTLLIDLFCVERFGVELIVQV